VVKTTIELPDELFLKVKVIAAERRLTLKDLLVQALQGYLQASPEAEAKKRKATMKKLLKAMRATNTEPMVPLTREEIYAER
jgi:predicted transcriptional regulator